jgi:hypothetical protein
MPSQFQRKLRMLFTSISTWSQLLEVILQLCIQLAGCTVDWCSVGMHVTEAWSRLYWLLQLRTLGSVHMRRASSVMTSCEPCGKVCLMIVYGLCLPWHHDRRFQGDMFMVDCRLRHLILAIDCRFSVNHWKKKVSSLSLQYDHGA